MDEGNLKKYLVYAIGEILLVVIGILIALQINNWNELRKSQRQGYVLLQNLKQDLQGSKTSIESALAHNEMTLQHDEKLIQSIESNADYTPAIDSSFFHFDKYSKPRFIFSNYETLKSKGLELIEDPELRKAVTEVYEEEFDLINTASDNVILSFMLNIVAPYKAENIRLIGPGM